MDLQAYPAFQELDVQILSIALDSAEEQLPTIEEYGIVDVPLLVDADAAVSELYDVMKWAVGTGEPGHTFILVDGEGKLAWIRDYGSPSLPEPTMYVESQEMVDQIAASLQS